MGQPVTGDPLRWAEDTLRHYWSEDGLADILVGLFLMAYAWLFAYGQRNGAAWAKVLLILLVLLMAWQMRAVVDALKRRWVYPRVGYARPRPLPRATRLTRGAGVALAALLVLGLLMALEPPPGVTCLLTTGLMAGLWAWIGLRHGTTRHLLLAAVSVGWGLWHLARPGLACDLLALLLWTGALTALLGVLAFARFLHRYPQPRPEGEAP